MAQIDRGRDLTELVRNTAGRLHRNTLWTGAAWMALAALGWLVAAVGLDMAMPLPVALRVAAWVGFWGVLLIVAGVMLIRPRRHRPAMAHVALMIERAVGGMHNRLVTLLDATTRRGAEAPNPQMLQQLVEQTRLRITGFDAAAVINPRRLRQGLWGVGGLALVAVALFILLSDRVPTALARLAMPTADIPPVTWLRIEGPGAISVPRGEPYTLAGRVTRGSTEAMTLQLRSSTTGKPGPWVNYPMRPDGQGGFTFELADLNESFEYRLRSDRTWTHTYRLTAVPRPVVLDVRYEAHFPSYLSLDSPMTLDVATGQLALPIGTRLRVAASVEGEPVGGDLALFQSRTEEIQETLDVESVWFEDELPADADVQGRWPWTTRRVRSGLQSFASNWDGQPLAFKTRLSPLHVPQEGRWMLYLFMEEADPPTRLVVSLSSGDQLRTLVWGRRDEARERERPGTVVHVGPLPPVGNWVRLDYPVKQLFTAPAEGVKLHGMAIETDSGRVYFDRPGSFVQQTTTRTRTSLDSIGRLPMALREGRWEADVEISRSIHIGHEFRDALNSVNRAAAPLMVVALEDQPPSVVVERPGRDLPLAEPVAVPLAWRAFDDWGVEAVGVQTGPAADKLGEPRWLKRFDDNATERVLADVLDARKLEPGQTVYYRMVARDRKGQLGASEVYRLTHVVPQSPETAQAIKKANELEKLIKGLGNILRTGGKLAELAAAFLPELRKGEPLSDVRVRELAARKAAELTEAERAKLTAADAQVNQFERQLRNAAKQLEQAAKRTADSPLAPPREAEALSELSRSAEQMADMLKPAPSPEDQAGADAQKLERLAQAARLAQVEQGELDRLKKRLQQIEQASQRLAEDPESSQRELESVLAETRAEQADQSLRTFEDKLALQGRKTEELRTQLPAAPQANEPDREPLEARAKAQRELESQAEPLIESAENLTGQEIPRADIPDPAADPRQSLQADRDALQSRLKRAAQQVEQTRQESRELRREIAGLRGQMLPEMKRDEDLPPDHPPTDGAAPPGRDSSEPSPTQQLNELLSSRQARRLLELAESSALAEQADNPDSRGPSRQRTASQQGRPGEESRSAAEQSSPDTRRVTVLEGAARTLNASERAELYKLPPRIREPLLQGMRDQGPEGYQDLIDAYYRHLSRQAK